MFLRAQREEYAVMCIKKIISLILTITRKQYFVKSSPEFFYANDCNGTVLYVDLYKFSYQCHLIQHKLRSLGSQ